MYHIRFTAKGLEQIEQLNNKLRVGDYRAFYTFDQESQIIMIHFVQHRSEVYKDK